MHSSSERTYRKELTELIIIFIYQSWYVIAKKKQKRKSNKKIDKIHKSIRVSSDIDSGVDRKKYWESNKDVIRKSLKNDTDTLHKSKYECG